ncbi:MAG TPA: leucine-rich repeat domain-containing protein [Candidatus Saccharimonadales bacterium]|nr:leucine-rich repeat domain-containing protein [Candidatus Saccharimonadales bacterium]
MGFTRIVFVIQPTECITSGIGQLSVLKYLYLHNNQLSALPHEMSQLRALQKLYLSNNKL